VTAENQWERPDQKKVNALGLFTVLLWAILVVAFSTGCGVNKGFVRAARQFHKTVGAEYLEYVEKDPRYIKNPESKLDRTNNVRAFELLLEEAEKE